MLHTKLDQSLMFELEHVVESALQVAVPETADHVIEMIAHLCGTSDRLLSSLIDSRCRYFVSLPAQQRLKMLPAILETLRPSIGLRSSDQIGSEPHIIPLEAFGDDPFEWPAFEW